MLTCVFCRRSHGRGTVFCSGCGRKLVSRDRTSGLDSSVVTAPAPPSRQRRTLGAESVAPIAAGFQLTVLNTSRVVTFRGDAPVTLGRADLGRGVVPELDLAGDGGADRGVSRSHARIWIERGVCKIKDLGSANGTQVNGQRLTAYTAHTLSSGDEVQLGSMLLRITIQPLRTLR